MRTATIYNFLLEANLMASAAILLMILFRKFLRKPLGNRLVYFLWLLIAIRLLCPLAIANPWMNEFRPTFLPDEGIRPIAGQIKVRLTDAVDAVETRLYGQQSSVLYQGARSFVNAMYYGTAAWTFMQIYLYGAGAVALIFGISNLRFRRRLRVNRIEQISGKLQEQYLAVCRERNVKPIPVWFVDPLASACLVGVARPYIALPLTAAPQEAVHVLTHEVCHLKGRDHWWSVLRLVCCIIHWFNPLIWLAAFMSRTDGELACDTRVVQSLTQEARLNYTNTLVLAASKRYAPGVGVLATGMTMTGKKLQNRVRSILHFEHAVKWLTITTALLACVALSATFFTAEYVDTSASVYLDQVEGFYSVSANENDTFTDTPLQMIMPLDIALRYAMDAIGAEYQVDTQETENYAVHADFRLANTIHNPYMSASWVFQIVNVNTEENYNLFIRAIDGKVLEISGPGHG